MGEVGKGQPEGRSGKINTSVRERRPTPKGLTYEFTSNVYKPS